MYLFAESTEFYPCELCKLGFDTRQERIDHIINHFTQIQCDLCGKTILKICDLILEVHGNENCCASIDFNRTNGDTENVIDVDDSALNSRLPPKAIVNLFSNELKIAANPNISDKSNEIRTNASRRKSGRVRKKVCYNADADDGDNKPISHRIKRKNLVNNLSDNLKSEHIDETNIKSEGDDNYGYDSFLKEEHCTIDESTDVDWSVGGNPTLKIDRPDDAVLAEEILDGATADEEDYVPKIQRKRNAPKPLNIPCSICRTLFRTQRALQMHEKQVHGISPSTECDICKKIFTSVGNLKQHKQTHNDTRRYICSYCGKGFNLHFNLKDHINEHTGEKPYVCVVCGKAFGKASHRVAHMRVIYKLVIGTRIF